MVLHGPTAALPLLPAPPLGPPQAPPLGPPLVPPLRPVLLAVAALRLCLVGVSAVALVGSVPLWATAKMGSGPGTAAPVASSALREIASKCGDLQEQRVWLGGYHDGSKGNSSAEQSRRCMGH
jgi:hypothetical protein